MAIDCVSLGEMEKSKTMLKFHTRTTGPMNTLFAEMGKAGEKSRFGEVHEGRFLGEKFEMPMRNQAGIGIQELKVRLVLEI